MMGAVVVKPSFQPGKGYDSADSTILGRTMLRTALAHRAPQDGRARYSGPSAAETGPFPTVRGL